MVDNWAINMTRVQVESQSGWTDGKRRWAPAVRWVIDNHIQILLEIGTSYGTSLSGWVEDAKCPYVASLDIDDSYVDGLIERFPTVKFYRGISDIAIPPDVMAELKSKQWDLIVVDTSHEYLHTKKELKLMLELNPKFVVFDDITWGSSPTDKGEGEAIRESGIAFNELSGTGVGWFEMNAENRGKIEALKL